MSERLRNSVVLMIYGRDGRVKGCRNLGGKESKSAAQQRRPGDFKDLCGAACFDSDLNLRSSPAFGAQDPAVGRACGLGAS